MYENFNPEDSDYDIGSESEKYQKWFDLYGSVAYRPTVEIIVGNDIVKQSGQDYSNTLKTSETLSFSKTGIVKLKIKYEQIDTAGNRHFGEIFDSRCYNPEKTVTINVTDSNTTSIASGAPSTTISTPLINRSILIRV